jgi:hypothetical protein
LSHKIEENSEGEEEAFCFFGDGSFEKRVAAYDAIEEGEDPYLEELVQKFFYFVSFWYVSKTNDKEELQKLLDMAENEDMTGLEETEIMVEKLAAEEISKAKERADEEKPEAPVEEPEAPVEEPEAPLEEPEPVEGSEPVEEPEEPVEEPDAPEETEEKK